MAKDYYEVLGVTKGSTDDEIKRAYRKMALQYHPDKNKEASAAEKFKEVTHAYEVLSDPQKRQTYDQFGAAAFEQGGAGPFGGAQGGQGNPFGGQYGPFSYSYSTNGGDGGFDFGGFADPFEQFFGGGFSRQQRRQVYSLTIDFMEAVHGVTKQVTINGKEQTIKIPPGVDNGSRIRFGEYDILLQVNQHETFAREGNDIVTQEEISFGQAALGTELTVETVDGKVTVKIPGGTQPNAVIRLREKGVPNVRGNGKGDHYLRIKVVVPKNLTAKQKELLKEFDGIKDKKGWF
jgi:DnaJ-class molecular chaperone